MDPWLRLPAVSGTFYTNEPEKLRQQLDRFMPEAKPVRAVAVMAPHAGYRYSGAAAGEVYRRTHIPSLVVIVCPNHTGRGPRISVWGKGKWRTPLGEVAVDEEAADLFLRSCPAAKLDTVSHEQEHAIEVHLPFLQARNPNVRILPVVLGPLPFETVRGVGEALAAVVKSAGEGLLVASTDMSHYVSVEEAALKDRLALERFEKLDAHGLYETVAREEISMCGFIPTACVLTAAKALSGREAKILKYTHSGVVTGDESSVVAYAAGWVLP